MQDYKGFVDAGDSLYFGSEEKLSKPDTDGFLKYEKRHKHYFTSVICTSACKWSPEIQCFLGKCPGYI